MCNFQSVLLCLPRLSDCVPGQPTSEILVPGGPKYMGLGDHTI